MLKNSRVKVTVWSNMSQSAIFGLVVVTCWQRHNSQQNRNHHVVFIIFSVCCNLHTLVHATCATFRKKLE